MPNNNTFEDIFNDDPLGLLDVAPVRRSSQRTEDQRLIDGFSEIVGFYEENDREPDVDGDLGEFLLFSRLEGIRSNPSKVERLLPFDFYNLLDESNTPSIPLEKIVSDDPFGILDDDELDESIFQLKHVERSDRLDPDYVARRTVCRDFEKYKAGFEEVVEALHERKKKLTDFNGAALKAGEYYLLNGVLVFLEKMDLEETTSDFKSGARTRIDGRTHCVFDNGTESTMLMRSLEKALNRPHEGYRIIDVAGEDSRDSNYITEDDIQSGYIYVLSSLSDAPSIRDVKNLYKIGFSARDVTERIKNAEKEPTYLMAPVKLLRSIRCFNLDPHELESQLHTFFADGNLDIEVTDESGIIHRPKEWFQVPLPIIDEALELIQAGTFGSYKYDAAINQIVLR